jgi:magnesium-transporting ATPase (P-type)
MTDLRIGLHTAEVLDRRHTGGPNELPPPPRPHPALMLLHQTTHLLAVLLWVAAGLALLAGTVPLAIAIVVVVLLNAVFAFAQEYRADRATERLRTLLPVAARVRRDGVEVTIDATDLVSGDVVLLTAGDRVPADVTLVEAARLRVDESMITGESVPVARREGERALAGTFVVEGTATCIVSAIGAGTELAAIASLTRSATRPPSPLTIELRSVVRVVAVIAAAVGVLLASVSMLLGLEPTEAFLFGVGVTVALVPEGLLPTVTLSLARGAQLMAAQQALVRRLDAVETLGATTFICTDKTGTLTQNRMSVVEVWTAAGQVLVEGSGYAPQAEIRGPARAIDQAATAATHAARCVTGRAVLRDEDWHADGDPLEAALHAWCLRATGAEPVPGGAGIVRNPFSAARMLSSAELDGELSVLGAPESVLSRCVDPPSDAVAALHDMASRGRRVLAVASRRLAGDPLALQAVASGDPAVRGGDSEVGLTLLALAGLEDPPRTDVTDALQSCRDAGIRVAMVTGDHAGTAASIAREVGLLSADGLVVDGSQLPTSDAAVADLLDRPGGVVVARVSPPDKLRIARALRRHGHVVAMTGDGVNDAPALREADVGVAMGASGSDVAREAADLVLLDDHFGTIVAAIELGRATFANVRRFLTYHLTDNVAELTPFAVWALCAGNVPLAIGVLQVLALDIGTDMLPALALGAEPPSRQVMRRAPHRRLVDRRLLGRAFGVLGPIEASAAMTAFVVVLLAGGWGWGQTPSDALLATASGSAFAAIALGQMANAFACRSTSQQVWRLDLRGNPLVVYAVLAELGLLVGFVGVPALQDLLGGTWPSLLGWSVALVGAAMLVAGDGIVKRLVRHPPAAPTESSPREPREQAVTSAVMPPERPARAR